MFTMPASPPMPSRCYLDTCNSNSVLTLEMVVLLSRRLATMYFCPFPYVRVACDQKNILLVRRFISFPGRSCCAPDRMFLGDFPYDQVTLRTRP